MCVLVIGVVVYPIRSGYDAMMIMSQVLMNNPLDTGANGKGKKGDKSTHTQ